MTLVEVMVVVALSSILLGIVISVLIGLKQWDRKVRQLPIQYEQMARLAESVRADIRQAVDVSLPANNTLIIDSADERQTRYELVPEGCRRVAGPGEPGPPTDLFAMGAAASWSVEDGTPGRRPMAVVTLHRLAKDAKTSLAPLVVYAAVGADLPPQSLAEPVE